VVVTIGCRIVTSKKPVTNTMRSLLATCRRLPNNWFPLRRV